MLSRPTTWFFEEERNANTDQHSDDCLNNSVDIFHNKK